MAPCKIGNHHFLVPCWFFGENIYCKAENDTCFIAWFFGSTFFGRIKQYLVVSRVHQFCVLASFCSRIYPPWNWQFAPENGPSQKETSLPTIHFSGYVSSREGNCVFSMAQPWHIYPAQPSQGCWVSIRCLATIGCRTAFSVRKPNQRVDGTCLLWKIVGWNFVQCVSMVFFHVFNCETWRFLWSFYLSEIFWKRQVFCRLTLQVEAESTHQKKLTAGTRWKRLNPKWKFEEEIHLF